MNRGDAADIPQTGRGDAADIAQTGRGDAAARTLRFEATPRLRRAHSEETSHDAATMTFGRRRVDTSRGDARTRIRRRYPEYFAVDGVHVRARGLPPNASVHGAAPRAAPPTALGLW